MAFSETIQRQRYLVMVEQGLKAGLVMEVVERQEHHHQLLGLSPDLQVQMCGLQPFRIEEFLQASKATIKVEPL